MPPRKGGATMATTHTPESGATATASRLNTLMGSGNFRYLLDVGPYAVFWVNNRQLEIFKMQGTELVSIRSIGNCNNIWNVLELHLTDEGVIPAADAPAADAASASGGGGTTSKRVSRLKQPVQAGVASNSST